MAHGRDLLGVLVGDLETCVLLERVDELDEVEGIGVEVLLKRRVHGDLLGLTAKALDDDVLEVLEAQLLSFLTRSTLPDAGAWGSARPRSQTRRRCSAAGSGRLLLRERRRYAELCHELDLVVHQVAFLHQTSIDVEALDELNL